MLKQNASRYFLFALSLLLYLAMGYQIARHQTFLLFTCYFSLFLFYILVIRKHHTIPEAEIKFWIVAAITFRLVLLFSVPALSDDFYRFVWDGRLLAAGYHPFAEVPSFYMPPHPAIPGIDAALYNKLNATETFTVYPPLAQFIFLLSVKLSPDTLYGSVIVMKTIVFGFEIATLWILSKVLHQFDQPRSRILIYALNPLVVLELTGNLHFEGIMIFFLLVAIWSMREKKTHLSSLAYALSVCAKLLPLVFLPLLLRHLGWKKAVYYWFVTAIFTLLIFLPLLNMEIIHGLSTSLGYYFQRFEFNASIYYLIRQAGYLIAGFNIIQYAGPFLAFVALTLILFISFRNFPKTITGVLDPAIFTQMLWCLSVYFLCVTILHPWYIITLLAISLLTTYRFPVVWTASIFLTYAGYTETSFDENLLFVASEYFVVITYMLYETVWKQRNHS